MYGAEAQEAWIQGSGPRLMGLSQITRAEAGKAEARIRVLGPEGFSVGLGPRGPMQAAPESPVRHKLGYGGGRRLQYSP